MERLEHNQEPIISSVQETNGTNGTNGVEQSFISINNKENSLIKTIYTILLA